MCRVCFHVWSDTSFIEIFAWQLFLSNRLLITSTFVLSSCLSSKSLLCSSISLCKKSVVLGVARILVWDILLICDLLLTLVRYRVLSYNLPSKYIFIILGFSVILRTDLLVKVYHFNLYVTISSFSFASKIGL